MEDVSGNWIFKSVVLGNYLLIQLVGNVFTFSTIHYERWGGDPRKRSLSNQLTSFLFVCFLLASTVNYSIYLVRAMTGPLGWFLASFYMCSRSVLASSSALAGFQIISHRCLQLYHWELASRLHDDWWAMFLALFDIMISLLFAKYRLFRDQFAGKQLFVFLSGLESQDPGQSGINPFTVILFIVGVISIVSAIVIINRKKVIESQKDHIQAGGTIAIAVISGPPGPSGDDAIQINDINNVKLNKDLGSASQYVLVISAMLLLNLPIVILNNSSLELGWITILLRDLPLQFSVGFLVPCLFFHGRPEIKAHLIKTLWEQAPDWIQKYHPDNVSPF